MCDHHPLLDYLKRRASLSNSSVAAEAALTAAEISHRVGEAYTGRAVLSWAYGNRRPAGRVAQVLSEISGVPLVTLITWTRPSVAA